MSAPAIAAGTAAVVRQDGVLAQALGQVVRDALRQPAGVDEHQGGAIFADEIGNAFLGGKPAETTAWTSGVVPPYRA